MQTTISLASDNEDILLVKLAGKISLKTLYDFLIAFHELNTLPAHLRLLYDLQEAQIDLTKEDLVKISRMSGLITFNYQSVRAAFVVSDPDVTALTLYFAQLSEHPDGLRHLFSSKEAAMNWLRNQVNYNT